MLLKAWPVAQLLMLVFIMLGGVRISYQLQDGQAQIRANQETAMSAIRENTDAINNNTNEVSGAVSESWATISATLRDEAEHHTDRIVESIDGLRVSLKTHHDDE